MRLSIQEKYMVREQLSKLLTLRISPTEMDMLSRLADDTGLPMSAFVRQLVRREHESRYGAEPARRARPKPKK